MTDPGWDEPVAGNDDCVELLEKALAIAKVGRVCFAGVVMCQRPDDEAHFFAGDAQMEHAAFASIAALKADLDKAFYHRTVPAGDPSLGADHVTYNLAGGPLSYDFTTWLIDAEMTRIREGAPAPLKVAFWQSHDGSEARQMLTPHGRKMFANVIKPALALIGAVEEPYCGGRYKRDQLIADIVKASANQMVPFYRKMEEPCAPLEQYKGCVTITLREAEYTPYRNSRLEEWLRFAKYLRANGERVVFVRDTAKANEPLSGEKTLPLASLDLLIRARLYQDAKANLFVSNGPTNLALFGWRPFLVFSEVYADGHPYHAATPYFWRERFGIDPDTDWQYPWCRPDQRVVWKPDTYANMVEAWERWIMPARQEAAE